MRFTLIAATLALAALSSAHADTQALSTDGSWAEFAVDKDSLGNLGWMYWKPQPQGSDLPTALSFSVDIPAGYVGTLTVVDRVVSGDTFSVTDNGAALGTTGAVSATAGAFAFSADDALANPAFSRGVFTLSAGSHTLSGSLLQSAIDPDVGALNSTLGGVNVTITAVPEPATAATLLIGLGLLVGAARRRNA